MGTRGRTVASLVVAAIAIVAAFATTAAGGSAAPSGGPARTITVSATASISSTPDQAVVTFGVRADSADSVAALDESARTMNAVIAAMKDLGITEREMRTTNVSVSQQTIDRGTPAEATVFVSSASLEVTIENFERIGPAIRDGVEAGATSVRGVRFQVADPADAKKRALEAAVGSARAKADALAGAAGAAVTGVVRIDEQGPGGYPRPYVAQARTLSYAFDEALAVVPPRDIETDVTITTVWSVG